MSDNKDFAQQHGLGLSYEEVLKMARRLEMNPLAPEANNQHPYGQVKCGGVSALQGDQSVMPFCAGVEESINAATDRAGKLAEVLFELHTRLFGEPERGPEEAMADTPTTNVADAIRSAQGLLHANLRLAELYANQLAYRL